MNGLVGHVGPIENFEEDDDDGDTLEYDVEPQRRSPTSLIKPTRLKQSLRRRRISLRLFVVLLVRIIRLFAMAWMISFFVGRGEMWCSSLLVYDASS